MRADSTELYISFFKDSIKHLKAKDYARLCYFVNVIFENLKKILESHHPFKVVQKKRSVFPTFLYL